MGALLSKPLTEKDSECGEFKLGSRALSYAATGMQGWRMSMEVTKLWTCYDVFSKHVRFERVVIEGKKLLFRML